MMKKKVLSAMLLSTIVLGTVSPAVYATDETTQAAPAAELVTEAPASQAQETQAVLETEAPVVQEQAPVAEAAEATVQAQAVEAEAEGPVEQEEAPVATEATDTTIEVEVYHFLFGGGKGGVGIQTFQYFDINLGEIITITPITNGDFAGLVPAMSQLVITYDQAKAVEGYFTFRYDVPATTEAEVVEVEDEESEEVKTVLYYMRMFLDGEEIITFKTVRVAEGVDPTKAAVATIPPNMEFIRSEVVDNGDSRVIFLYLKAAGDDTTTETPAVTTEETVSTTEESAASTEEQATTTTEESTVSTEEQATTTEELVVTTEDSAAATEDAEVTIEESSVTTEESVTTTEESAASTADDLASKDGDGKSSEAKAKDDKSPAKDANKAANQTKAPAKSEKAAQKSNNAKKTNLPETGERSNLTTLLTGLSVLTLALLATVLPGLKKKN